MSPLCPLSRRTRRSLLKTGARRLLGGVCQAACLPRLRNRGRVLVLMYHRVLPEETARSHWVQPGMYVTPRSFEAQLEFLRRNFEVLSLAALLEAWASGCLDRRGSYCAITFDDGWRDGYTHAFPLLREREIPATVFLATSFVGTCRWFLPERVTFLLRSAGRAGWEALVSRCPVLRDADFHDSVPAGGEAMDPVIEALKEVSEERLQELVGSLEEELGVTAGGERLCLDWCEVREMSRHGVSFGSHSSTHRLLSRLPAPEIREELLRSREALAQEGVCQVPVLCYPDGDYSPAVKEAARSCGYQAAVTTRFGSEACRTPEDLFEIRRVGVHQDIAADEASLSFLLSDLPLPSRG